VAITEVVTRTTTWSSPHPLLHCQDFFISFINVHLRSGKQVFKIIILSDPAPGEGE
jgi:hypothetical protein